jgi:hypothetical protein
VEFKQASHAWDDDILYNARTCECVLNEDVFWVDLSEMDSDDYRAYPDDDTTARDCIDWEEDMIKNGEYF